MAKLFSRSLLYFPSSFVRNCCGLLANAKLEYCIWLCKLWTPQFPSAGVFGSVGDRQNPASSNHVLNTLYLPMVLLQLTFSWLVSFAIQVIFWTSEEWLPLLLQQPRLPDLQMSGAFLHFLHNHSLGQNKFHFDLFHL